MADKNQALAKALRTSSNEPQYIRGNLLPFKKDIKTKEVSFGMPTVAQGLIDALTAPYRAMKGEIDVDSPQGVQEALNFGLNMMGGGFGSTAVKPVQSGSLGMFIGRTSPSWNAAKAKQAVELEKAGLTPQKIWSQTGTVRGADGKLRQEIPDVGATITDNVYEGIKKNKNFTGDLNKALQHEELYKAYPEIKDVSTTVYASPLPEGSYHDATRTITVGGPSTGHQKSSALHEVQHGIQDIEGFARGGSPEDMRQTALDMLRRDVASGEIASTEQAMEMLPMAQQNAYRRIAGEAEARLTQLRRNLTPEQRLQFFPYDEGKDVYGLDVPFQSLIVR